MVVLVLEHQPVLEGIDDLVYELAVRGRVPPDPVAHVAPEAVAGEARRVVAVAALALAAAVAEVAVVAGDEVGQDLPVLRGEGGGEGEDGGGEEGEEVVVVGDGRRRGGVDGDRSAVELPHGGDGFWPMGSDGGRRGGWKVLSAVQEGG